MNNPLSREISIASILKFSTPTIIMNMFMSFYIMVDGVFVSRFVNTDALSAVNIVYPILNVVIAASVLLAMGGSAYVGRKMGMGEEREAREAFSFISMAALVVGLAIGLICYAFLDEILIFLGADENVFDYCYEYASGLLPFVCMAIFQILYQFFFVTAGRPVLGMICVISGGVANIFLDYLFIVPLDMGIKGAAYATGLGFTIPAIVGALYFSFSSKDGLRYVRTGPKFYVIRECTVNGAAGAVSNLSVAVTTYLYNVTMMDLLRSDGVAAITIVLYAEYLFSAMFGGYSAGVAPLFSYNYGKNEKAHLQALFKISIKFVSCASVLVFGAAYLISGMVVAVFAAEGTNVYDIAVDGMRIFSFCLLGKGLNIFTTTLFSALSHGLISGTLSFLRTFVLIAGTLIILPQIIGVSGVWLALPIAEGCALLISATQLYRKRALYFTENR